MSGAADPSAAKTDADTGAKTDAWRTGAVAGARPGAARTFPTELMLHVMLSARYTGWAPIVRPGARVLDVGALHGGNLVPFADRGCVLSAVEVNAEMVAVTRAGLADFGIEADVREGVNRALPFDDASVDILISVNVIHYEDDAGGLSAALAEYARVLAPGGRAFVVSAAPAHFIRKTAERLGPNRYRLAYDDFRKGQVMAYFEDEAQMAALAAPAFARTLTGRSTERHPAASLDFFYLLAER